MITLDYTPIEVEINVEAGNLVQGAFYTVGFITKHDTAPRTVAVHSLQDVLNAGYKRGSEAYNFVKGVLIQGQMNTVILRAVRAHESYSDAYLADDNSEYYYVVIGSKQISDVLQFNDTLANEGSLKLQFFSTNIDVSDEVEGRKLVYYYYQHDTGNSDFPVGFADFPTLAWDSLFNVLLDTGNYIYLSPFNVQSNIIDSGVENVITQDDGSDLTFDQAQGRAIKYAEGAWLGYCGNFFPSQIQWLYKNIQNVDSHTKDILTEIPNLSTTTVIMPQYGDKSTLGSGKTCEGFPIHEVVSLDWVRYALQKKLWEVFYNTERVPATTAGMALLENAVRYVLDIAVQQGIFESYTITGSKLASEINRASFTFEATLTQTILEVKKVEGTIYH